MAEMGRCKDCWWWKPMPPESGWEPWGGCFMVGQDFDQDRPAVVVASDDPADLGGFFTRPDFGCAQFKATSGG